MTYKISYKEYLQGIMNLLAHAYLYYEVSDTVITDYDYDRRYQTLRNYEVTYPEKAVDFSPTQMIGWDAQFLKRAMKFMEKNPELFR